MTSPNVPFPDLLSPPINRAAYSDRTAWLMALMSKLAYTQFEAATSVDVAISEAMTLISGSKNPDDQESSRVGSFKKSALLEILKRVAGSSDREANLKYLEDSLQDLQFSLIKTFSVNIPLIADTQAFIAKLSADGRPPFLVLAFRGTEPKKAADIKADLDASAHTLGYLGGPGASRFYSADDRSLTAAETALPKVKVHPGFWKAFKAVESELLNLLSQDELAQLPLYITGHSLGGALAVVATYSLPSDRIAACYTYGGPRVGNLQFGQRIKPPVYRVVNASDLVPRVPPGVAVDVLTVLLRAIPAIPYLDKVADFLERFRGYRHYGDMRYLNDAESAEDSENRPNFPDLLVLSNPPQISRWYWLWKRWVQTWGRAAMSDHSIDIYEQKLAYWAHVRSNHK